MLIVSILCFILLFISLYLYSESRHWKNEYQNLYNKTNNINSKNDIIISNVQFKNIKNDGEVINNYGERLHRTDIRFIVPRISYKSFMQKDKRITINIKIIDPKGIIIRNKLSPTDYTYNYDFTSFTGDEKTIDISGWGKKDFGIFQTGKHFVEFWHENILIGSGSFFVL